MKAIRHAPNITEANESQASADRRFIPSLQRTSYPLTRHPDLLSAWDDAVNDCRLDAVVCAIQREAGNPYRSCEYSADYKRSGWLFTFKSHLSLFSANYHGRLVTL